MMQRRTAIYVILSSLLAATQAGCGGRAPSAQPLAQGSNVLALGDSLTAGVGAAAGQDWPAVLSHSTGWNITNAGVSGDTSAQALARLPELLTEHTPQLVIVGLGGNDFLRRVPHADTVAALTAIVYAVQAAQAQVVLVAIPQPSLRAAAGGTPQDHPLYAQLAKELNIPLLEQLWGPILGQSQLRSDQVHANAQGYAQFAQALEKALRQQGWL